VVRRGTGIIDSMGQNGFGPCTEWSCGDGQPSWDYVPVDTRKRDDCHGLRLFAESCGYAVDTNFIQHIAENTSGTFTFEQFKSEIDAGRIVLIHLTNHTMLGYGCSTADQTIQVRNTRGYSTHTMT